VPINPKELTGTRVTVSYDETGHRTVWRDAWTNPTRNLHDPKQIWTGWTFLELAEPREDNLGGKLEKDVGRSSVQSFPVYEKENKDGFAETPEMNTTGSLGTAGKCEESEGSKGYRVGTVEEKGKLVAQQLPVKPKKENTVINEVTDDDGSEWAFVTDFEKVG